MMTTLALRKTSLIDFPGRVSAVLFTKGCNFRCPYCHNADLVRTSGEPQCPVGALPGEVDESFSLDGALAFLKKRAGLVSGVVLSGGEPLFHDDLAFLARRIAALGLAVKLDTNGSFPDRIAGVRADFISLDLKTSPSSYARVAPALRNAGNLVVESLALIRSAGHPYEVRITCAPGVLDLPDLDGLMAVLERRDDVVLQPFRPGACLDPAWDSVLPYPETVLEVFLGLIRGVAPKARIRGQARPHA